MQEQGTGAAAPLLYYLPHSKRDVTENGACYSDVWDTVCVPALNFLLHPKRTEPALLWQYLGGVVTALHTLHHREVDERSARKKYALALLALLQETDQGTGAAPKQLERCHWAVVGLEAASRWMEENVQGFDHFLTVLLPAIVHCALELPTLFPEQNQDVLPALMSGTTASVTLSRAQVRCLLANSFFCNLPSFTDQHRERHYHGFCSVCWRDVYLSKDGVGVERIKCQLNYLHYALIKQRCVTGNIVIHRTCVNAASGGFPAWDTCEAPLLAPAQMHDAVKIELTNAGYQIDFANRDLHMYSFFCTKFLVTNTHSVRKLFLRLPRCGVTL
eukprot:TRINITY_DN1966_c0_g1_i3.p1 TRINITY_DN1966_c0_g1~~TRINITY_DN1966_c0_g1_i3.p1  ORF type:complete len:338 (-),score=69.73 TRINITY_DN1966_c0_g1_i3:805-1797(-)